MHLLADEAGRPGDDAGRAEQDCARSLSASICWVRPCQGPNPFPVSTLGKSNEREQRATDDADAAPLPGGTVRRGAAAGQEDHFNPKNVPPPYPRSGPVSWCPARRERASQHLHEGRLLRDRNACRGGQEYDGHDCEPGSQKHYIREHFLGTQGRYASLDRKQCDGCSSNDQPGPFGRLLGVVAVSGHQPMMPTPTRAMS